MRPIATYIIKASVPEALNRLPDIAYNIFWSWDHEAIQMFIRMDEDLWEQTHHNPVEMLGLLSAKRYEQLINDDGFMAQYQRVVEAFDSYMSDTGNTWYDQTYSPEPEAVAAYFSFEFGLTESIRNYSGGLGVLAGDHLKAASDLNVPLMGVGLLYQHGYFRQYLNNDGWQQELYPINNFSTMPLDLMTADDGNPIIISVDLAGQEARAQIWQVQVGRVSLYLLDTNLLDNPPEVQALTDQLYGGDRDMRIRQEILLGVGGYRALVALGKEPLVCHMNEGHAAFMAFERCRALMSRTDMDFQQARAILSASNLFTTHTPVPAGNDYFAPELIAKYMKPFWEELGITRKEFMALGRFDANNEAEHPCMTIYALRMSSKANGVSQLHGAIARDMWQDVYPGVPIDEVPIDGLTNGIHTFSWVSREFANLFDRYFGPRWREAPADPTIWARAASIPDEEIWRSHVRRRLRLVAYARDHLVKQLEGRGAPSAEIKAAHEALDPDILTIGFARRFATYKRATLLLRDSERLLRIVKGDRPVQFIFAGKAHPHDNHGKAFIQQLVDFAYKNNCQDRFIFLEDYDMVTARYMVQGCDVWMNTPRRPMEASGTSGMKAILNGVLNLSILDGWWAEAYNRDVGWAIGRGEEYSKDQYEEQDRIEANAVYELIEKDMVPLFYDGQDNGDNLPRGWIAKMKAGFVQLAAFFSTARMVQDYTSDYYYPCLVQARELSENDYERGLKLAAWQKQVDSNWPDVVIKDVEADVPSEIAVGDESTVEAHVYLGSLTTDDVMLQLYEGPLDQDGNIVRAHTHNMALVGPGNSEGWYVYTGTFAGDKVGQHGFSVRAVPKHPDLGRAMRLGLVSWA